MVVQCGAKAVKRAIAPAKTPELLVMLSSNSALRLAVVCDGSDDAVPVTIGIRGKGTCELLIPNAKFDPFAQIDLIGQHGGKVR